MDELGSVRGPGAEADYLQDRSLPNAVAHQPSLDV